MHSTVRLAYIFFTFCTSAIAFHILGCSRPCVSLTSDTGAASCSTACWPLCVAQGRMQQANPGGAQGPSAGRAADPPPPAAQHITLLVTATEAVRIHLPGLRARPHSSSGSARSGAEQQARPSSAPAPAQAETSQTEAAACAATPASLLLVPDSGHEEQEAPGATTAQQRQQQLEHEQALSAAVSSAEPDTAALQAGAQGSDSGATSSSCASPGEHITLLAAACREDQPAKAASDTGPGPSGTVEEETPDAATAIWEHESAGHTPWATAAVEAAADVGEEQAVDGQRSPLPSPPPCLSQSAGAAEGSLFGTLQAQEAQGCTPAQAALGTERAARLAAVAELQHLAEAARVRRGQGDRVFAQACMTFELQQGGLLKELMPSLPPTYLPAPQAERASFQRMLAEGETQLQAAHSALRAFEGKLSSLQAELLAERERRQEAEHAAQQAQQRGADLAAQLREQAAAAAAAAAASGASMVGSGGPSIEGSALMQQILQELAALRADMQQQRHAQLAPAQLAAAGMDTAGSQPLSTAARLKRGRQAALAPLSPMQRPPAACNELVLQAASTPQPDPGMVGTSEAQLVAVPAASRVAHQCSGLRPIRTDPCQQTGDNKQDDAASRHPDPNAEHCIR